MIVSIKINLNAGCIVSDDFGHLTNFIKLWFTRNNTGGNEAWHEEKMTHLNHTRYISNFQ